MPAIPRRSSSSPQWWLVMSAAANPVFCSSVRLARTIRRLPSSIQTMSVMASKVRSHSFFSREISSKRIAFSSAIAMCLATGSSSARSRSE